MVGKHRLRKSYKPLLSLQSRPGLCPGGESQRAQHPARSHEDAVQHGLELSGLTPLHTAQPHVQEQEVLRGAGQLRGHSSMGRHPLKPVL